MNKRDFVLKKFVVSLEKLLDYESTNENIFQSSTSELKNTFHISDNLNEIENLSYAFQERPVDSTNIERLVEKISCFFEIVFLVDLNSSKTSDNKSLTASSSQTLELVYIYGKKTNPINKGTGTVIPNVPVYKVFKTSAFRFLEKFQIQSLDQNKKMNCYLIRVSKKYAFVLVGQLAEPWSKIRVETLQNALMKINFL
jgi:hypothetical protein